MLLTTANVNPLCMVLVVIGRYATENLRDTSPLILYMQIR